MNQLLPWALRVMGLAICLTCGLIRAQAQEPAAAPPKAVHHAELDAEIARLAERIRAG